MLKAELDPSGDKTRASHRIHSDMVRKRSQPLPSTIGGKNRWPTRVNQWEKSKGVGGGI